FVAVETEAVSGSIWNASDCHDFSPPTATERVGDAPGRCDRAWLGEPPDHLFRVNVISKDLNSFPSRPGLKPALGWLSLFEQSMVVRNFAFFPAISISLPVKAKDFLSASNVPVHMFIAVPPLSIKNIS